MNWKPVALLIAITIHAASSAEAQASPGPREAHFSDHGRTMVGGSVGGYWSSRPANTADGWSVWLQPSVGYFVADRIGLGLTPGYSTGAEPSNIRYHEASLAAYAIVDVALAERLSLLVQPSVGYAHRWRDAPAFDLTPINSSGPSLFAGTSIERQTDTVRLALNLPVAYHLSDSVVVGLGPFVQYEHRVGRDTASSSSATLGGQTVGFSRFTPVRDVVHVGLQSFIGVSF